MDGGDKTSSSSQSDNDREERIEVSDDIPNLSLEKLVECTVSKFLEAAPVIGPKLHEGYAKLATMMHETYNKLAGEKKMPKIVYTTAGGKKAIPVGVATTLIGAASIAKSVIDYKDAQETKRAVLKLDTEFHDQKAADLEKSNKLELTEKHAEEREKHAEEREKRAEEREKLAEERKKLAEEKEKLAEEREKRAEEREKRAEEREKRAEEREKRAEENEKQKLKFRNNTGGTASLRNPVEILKSYRSSPRDVEEGPTTKDKTTKHQSGIEE